MYSCTLCNNEMKDSGSSINVYGIRVERLCMKCCQSLINLTREEVSFTEKIEAIKWAKTNMKAKNITNDKKEFYGICIELAEKQLKQNSTCKN